MERIAVTHTIPPVFDAASRVLVLGSFPSPKSREVGFFYGHPQNRMWRVLACVLDESIVPQSTAERTEFLLRHHIAMWDTIESCTIVGASDSSIRDVVPQQPFPNTLSRPDPRGLHDGGESIPVLQALSAPDDRDSCIPVTIHERGERRMEPRATGRRVSNRRRRLEANVIQKYNKADDSLHSR